MKVLNFYILLQTRDAILKLITDTFKPAPPSGFRWRSGEKEAFDHWNYAVESIRKRFMALEEDIEVEEYAHDGTVTPSKEAGELLARIDDEEQYIVPDQEVGSAALARLVLDVLAYLIRAGGVGWR